MKIGIISMLICACAVTSFGITQAKPKTYNVRLYGLVEHFEWEETFNGEKFVEESGPLFGLGGELDFQATDRIWLEGRGEIFGGDVDYDGFIQTFDGDLVPYESDTTYFGAKFEGDAAYKMPLSDDFYVKPYAGLGVRAWERTLDTGTSDEFIGDYGYVEDWVTIYAIAGLGGGLSLNKDTELFGKIEIHIPIDNTIHDDLSNLGGPSDIELEPGKENSMYADAGINIKMFTASVFVETLKFSQSPLDDKYHAVLQPDSESTMVGVKAGLVF